MLRNEKVTVNIFYIASYLNEITFQHYLPRERITKKYREYNYKIVPVASRLQTVIITDVVKVCHVS